MSLYLSVLVFIFAFEYVEDGFVCLRLCLSLCLSSVSKNFCLSLSLFSFVFVNMWEGACVCLRVFVLMQREQFFKMQNSAYFD